MGGEVRWGEKAFQGKGFRSLGQEAIYAGGIRLRRGARYRDADGIVDRRRPRAGHPRSRHDARHARRRRSRAQVLSAQMGKAGPPMFGKDLHTGDWAGACCRRRRRCRSGSLSIAGLAMGFWREALRAASRSRSSAKAVVARRVARGDQPVRGAQAAGGLLRREQPDGAVDAGARNSAARVFADKAVGYGMPGITIDGTDPDADRRGVHLGGRSGPRRGWARRSIELVSMRMCGHAHHDDMLYLGKETPPSWDYPPLTTSGYANREHYEFWAKRDPIAALRGAARGREGHHARRARPHSKREAEAIVERQARGVIDAPWPEPARSRRRRLQGRTAAASAIEVLEPERPPGDRRSPVAAAAGARARPAVRQEGQHACSRR